MKKTYAYHKPSAKSLELIKQIRQAYSALDELVTSLCPNSREKSVAFTELESSAMWAIKSIVCNDTESEVEQ